MIFVTVGAGDFNALIEAMDALAPPLAADGEKVLLQIGHGAYVPQHAEYFRFAPSLEPYYDQAAVIVSHGGIGVVTEVLRKGKRLVGVSNHDRYDDHQDDLLRAMAARGHLIWCQDLRHLAAAITEARHAVLTPYQEEPGQIADIIIDFLVHGRRPRHE